jgi:hypothetical protein
MYEKDEMRVTEVEMCRSFFAGRDWSLEAHARARSSRHDVTFHTLPPHLMPAS